MRAQADTESRCAQYDAALGRFERWLERHQEPDGLLQGENLSCSAYMPLPPDIWTNTLAHKMAWAAWTLFGLTRQNSYVEYAWRIADRLVTLQQPDGGLSYPEIWPCYAEAPPEAKYNRSAQFCTWIAYTRAVAKS